LQIGPGGSSGRMLYAIRHDDGLRIKTGCFWGTIDEFRAAVNEKAANDPHRQYYTAVLALLLVQQALWENE
jgi:hypothetical protein